jgi:hypothetical protein
MSDPSPGSVEAKSRSGFVRFDGRMLTIAHTRYGGPVTRNEKQIPLRHLSAVQFKQPGWWSKGFIQFTVGGGIEKKSEYGFATENAARDENSLLFARAQQGEFEEFRDVVLKAMRAF